MGAVGVDLSVCKGPRSIVKKSSSFFILLFLCTAVLVARLYYVQLANKIYRVKADRTAVIAMRTYSSRGCIYDREARLLVANRNSYNLVVTPNQVNGVDTLALCRILGLGQTDFAEALKKCIQKNTKYRKSVFKRLLSPTEVVQFQELSYRFPGFYLQRNPSRTYPYPFAAHILGYIGAVSARFLKSHPSYQAGENTGISGIEKTYENVLRGKPGIRFARKDVRNRVVGSYANGRYDTLPQPGRDITTTIDIDLQRYGERLMKNKRGAIVALEPETGEILSLVTSPSYDPNLLVGRKRDENYSALLRDGLDKPLLNRAIAGTYPPGSTFKLVTALIGEREKVLIPQTTHTCHHGFQAGKFHISCHCGTTAPIHLETAIAVSCNNFFAHVYWDIIKRKKTPATGLETWRAYVRGFGFGDFLGTDLSTGAKGYIPDSHFYDEMYGRGRWNALNTISNGIGQGEVLATPIQLANMAAIIANRGWYYTPHIVKKIGGIPNENPNFTEKRQTAIAPPYFTPVIQGMARVITEGSAQYTARIPDIALCGKTGTAQNPHGAAHSIFVGFAPKENPTIALAVVVENGDWGSRWAAPIASLMVEKYIAGAIETPARKAVEKHMIEGHVSAPEELEIHG